MTDTTKHTPGPWKLDTKWALIMHGATEICAIHTGNFANARLIASAPDLLEALQEYLNIDNDLIGGMPRTERHEDADSQARAAIAKATGEEVTT